MATIPRLFHPPAGHFFLFGPRGTGKSTWLRQTFPDALWIDLLSPDVFRRLVANPERLLELIAGNPDRKTVVIDEVQKAPALLDVVHLVMEREDPPRFVLTGSSSRKLKRAGVDLLAGRAVLKRLHPFMAAELGDRFDLNAALSFGLVPLIWNAAEPREVLRSYVSLYIREEVQLEGLVRNVGDFSRFLEAISLSHGSVLNLAEVARECEVSRKTVESYLSILEDLLLSFQVPIFTRRARRQLSSHPKFYLFDAGVFRSLRPSGPLDAPSELAGAALEGLVAQHLRAWIDLAGGDSGLYFWRTKAGNEVDFVVYGPQGFWAIEVKHSSTIHPRDLSGLKAFREDYPEATALLLYRGGETLRVGDVWCVPVDRFLRELGPERGVWVGAG